MDRTPRADRAQLPAGGGVIDDRVWDHVRVPRTVLFHPDITPQALRIYCLVTWHLESQRDDFSVALLASESRGLESETRQVLLQLEASDLLPFMPNRWRVVLGLLPLVPPGSTVHASGFQRWTTSASPLLMDDVWEEGEWIEPATQPTGPASGARYAKAPIPQSLRVQVFERDGYRCQTPGCGSWKDLQVDHIHPESLGGPTTLGNLQTLCRPCNGRKGTKLADTTSDPGSAIR